MSKRFGQNFLVNRRARERILEELDPSPGDRVWEVGPGIGAMSALILEAGGELTVFEIDHGFCRLLQRLFGANPRFRLVEGDFLDTFPGEFEAEGGPLALFGNLPYNAAAAIIAAIIESGRLPPRMVFTVQKEAALRMASGPGSKDYSAFSVLCASACSVRLAFDLGGGSFWPAPKVTSTVVTLAPRPDPLLPGERKAFSRFVRQAFSSRRKTLKNNLRGAGFPDVRIESALEKLGLRADLRAEVLAPEVLAALYGTLRT